MTVQDIDIKNDLINCTSWPGRPVQSNQYLSRFFILRNISLEVSLIKYAMPIIVHQRVKNTVILKQEIKY